MPTFRRTINCKGRLLSLERPVVMGIINVTPDSFYGGSRYNDLNAVLHQAGQMLEAGATIIDIGGMSSRPGADVITPEEELRRVIPAIDGIVQAYPEAFISIDTIQPEVARRAVDAGAVMINDISAGRIAPGMYETVAELGVPYVLMHMKGTPQTMQQEARYDDVVQEVLDFFIAEVDKLRSLGVKDIILDPGFGFGKTIGHNFELLKNMHAFHILPYPILAGISRKSMIYRTLGTTAEHALNGTTALHMVALQQGASILRTHDVKEAVETIVLWERMESVNRIA